MTNELASFNNTQSLTNQTMTNLFLYGTVHTPDYHERLRSADDLRPEDDNIINLDAVSHMQSGPGRYANAAMAPIIRYFFESNTVPTGTYNATQMLALFNANGNAYKPSRNDFVSHETSTDNYPFDFQLTQHKINPNDADYGLRTYIYNKESYLVDQDNLNFVVGSNGTKSIQGLKVLPFDDNFDFISDWKDATNLGNLYLDWQVDPSGIGKQVDMIYTDDSKNAVPSVTYTSAMYNADVSTNNNVAIGSLTGNGLSAMNTVLDGLENAGVIEDIRYGDYNSNTFKGVTVSEIIVAGDGYDTLDYRSSLTSSSLVNIKVDAILGDVFFPEEEKGTVIKQFTVGSGNTSGTDTFYDVERLYLSDNNDSISINKYAGVNIIYGDDGIDTLSVADYGIFGEHITVDTDFERIVTSEGNLYFRDFEIFEGGHGSETAVFSGNYARSRLDISDDKKTVKVDGYTFKNFDNFRFADKTVTADLSNGNLQVARINLINGMDAILTAPTYTIDKDTSFAGSDNNRIELHISNALGNAGISEDGKNFQYNNNGSSTGSAAGYNTIVKTEISYQGTTLSRSSNDGSGNAFYLPNGSIYGIAAPTLFADVPAGANGATATVTASIHFSDDSVKTLTLDISDGQASDIDGNNARLSVKSTGITANNSDNVLYGNDIGNTFTLLAGNDTVYGFGGADDTRALGHC